MKKETKETFVSLWLGNSESEEELENYTEFDYSCDDVTTSALIQDFDIDADEIDEDSFESVYLPESSGIISVLLRGCSYEEAVVKEFQRKIGDKLHSVYNSVILVYDYQYDRKIPASAGEKNQFQFMGCVKIHYNT